jgi:hypothetical protein
MLLACALFLSPVLATAQPQPYTEALNPCVLTSTQAVSNLVPCGIKLSALGGITLSVKNMGTVGINVPTVDPSVRSPQLGRTAAPAGPPIQIDVYTGNQKIQSVYVERLAGNELKTVNVSIPSNYSKPKCAETRTLKMVVDPLSKVAESSEADNIRTSTTDRPCPDMAIEYINKNWNSLKTEFVAKIKLVNKGNAPAKFRYMALTSNSSAFGPLPSADFDV